LQASGQKSVAEHPTVRGRKESQRIRDVSALGDYHHITMVGCPHKSSSRLQEKQALEWGDSVQILFGDMRLIDVPEPADILVSELLGSFGDNELSPECLDGAGRFLKRKQIVFDSIRARAYPFTDFQLRASRYRQRIPLILRRYRRPSYTAKSEVRRRNRPRMTRSHTRLRMLSCFSRSTC